MEFNFRAGAGGASGYNSWIEERQAAVDRLAKNLGLPLGHRVEVWIRGGIRLVGKMTTVEERLFVEEERDLKLELQVDGVPFTPVEIEYCVRLD